MKGTTEMTSIRVLLAVATTLSWSCAAVRGNAQLTTYTMNKVFEVSATADHQETGTAFFAQLGSSVVLVTAKHVFEKTGFPTTTTFFLNGSGGWKPKHAAVKYGEAYDLAVITISDLSQDTVGIPLCDKDTHVGFDATLYFLGFPLGVHTDAVADGLAPFLPFVKRAGLSGGTTQGLKSHPLYVLDGLNNYGFSGGPVIFPQLSNLPFQGCVLGVTVAFQAGSEFVLDNRGKKTQSSVPYNSGLMYAVPSEGIRELVGQVAP